MKKCLFFPKINKIIFLLFSLRLINLSLNLYYKVLYLSDNEYYIINSQRIQFFDSNTKAFSNIEDIDIESMNLSDEEIEMINYGVFKSNLDKPNLLIIKNTIYSVEKDIYYCRNVLSDLSIYKLQIIPYTCDSIFCYIIISYLYNNQFTVQLYSIQGLKTSCSTDFKKSYQIFNIQSNNVKCEIMNPSSDLEILTCFFQTSNSIKAYSYEIDTDAGRLSIYSQKSYESTTAKIIRTSLSSDSTKSYACFIDDDNNYRCLIYDIISNQWTDIEISLNGCQPQSSSLFLDYYTLSNTFFLYCFETSTKLKLKIFNENSEVVYNNDDIEFQETFNDKCSEFSLISMPYDLNKIEIFSICDNEFNVFNYNDEINFNLNPNNPNGQQNIETTILTTLINSDTFDSSINTNNNEIFSSTISTIISSYPKNEFSPSTFIQKTSLINPSIFPSSIVKTSLFISSIFSSSIDNKSSTFIVKSSLINSSIFSSSINSKSSTFIEKTSSMNISIFSSSMNSINNQYLTSIPNIASSIINKNIFTTILNNPSIINSDTSSSSINNINNDINIIQEKINMTKEEVLENIENAMDNYDIGKIYEIFGDDYNIKISPINTNSYNNISTYINFKNCENILRSTNELNSSSLLTVYQIEINNNYGESLNNKVEYAIFDEFKRYLDLSVCAGEKIEINYQLNTSKVNITRVQYYADKGIDVFNIKDDFFNDICYSYSESDSDMILSDRVNDIYQNYSVCESDCSYEKVNLQLNTASCKCTIKVNVKSEINPPRLDTIIRDSFEDSNLAVIKCYNLVFDFRKKSKNIGFLIFSILTFLHIPFIL